MNEKKYEVEFIVNDNGRFLLFTVGLEPFIEEEENNEGYWQQHSTEEEIKSIDERYWKFAVPVEDGE